MSNTTTEGKEVTAMQDFLIWFENNYTSSSLEIKNKAQSLLPKEKENYIDFHVEVMKRGLINEGGAKWEEGFKPKIIKEATDYFNSKYNEKS